MEDLGRFAHVCTLHWTSRNLLTSDFPQAVLDATCTWQCASMSLPSFLIILLPRLEQLQFFKHHWGLPGQMLLAVKESIQCKPSTMAWSCLPEFSVHKEVTCRHQRVPQRLSEFEPRNLFPPMGFQLGQNTRLNSCFHFFGASILVFCSERISHVSATSLCALDARVTRGRKIT